IPMSDHDIEMKSSSSRRLARRSPIRAPAEALAARRAGLLGLPDVPAEGLVDLDAEPAPFCGDAHHSFGARRRSGHGDGLFRRAIALDEPAVDLEVSDPEVGLHAPDVRGH